MGNNKILYTFFLHFYSEKYIKGKNVYNGKQKNSKHFFLFYFFYDIFSLDFSLLYLTNYLGQVLGINFQYRQFEYIYVLEKCIKVKKMYEGK